ncbi:PilZ domain-containing protein [Bdellovibrio sp. HCB-162]|uniref:PilZ domain-containing protein n=1 Tax=Bdellovibrio sp. HCB-162 TaxID=3394234 RepID=UPI0039BD6003
MTQAELKRPTGVFLLAFLFILAPLGNLLISFAGSGVSGWYEPSVLFAFLQSVSTLDWLWLSLLFLTGVLLFRPHKTSWSLAIVSLSLVLLINAYRFFSHDLSHEGSFAQWQLVFSSLVTIAILILAFYFRFPYLDRRARWLFPTAHRYEFRTPVNIVGQDIFEGVTESISIAGTRVLLKRDMEGTSKELKYVDVIFPKIRNIKVKARVVEYRDNVLRLKFKELEQRDRGYLLDWIRSQIETSNESPG